MSADNGDKLRRFFGSLLIAAGALIATLCGACTVAVLVAGVGVRPDLSLVGFALMVGGVPTAVGVVLFRAGRQLIAPPPPREALRAKYAALEDAGDNHD